MKAKLWIVYPMIMGLGISSLHAAAYDTNPGEVYPQYPYESPGQAQYPGIFEHPYYDRFTSYEDELPRSQQNDIDKLDQEKANQ
jgi:hypothetical protein